MPDEFVTTELKEEEQERDRANYIAVLRADMEDAEAAAKVVCEEADATAAEAATDPRLEVQHAAANGAAACAGAQDAAEKAKEGFEGAGNEWDEAPDVQPPLTIDEMGTFMGMDAQGDEKKLCEPHTPPGAPTRIKALYADATMIRLEWEDPGGPRQPPTEDCVDMGATIQWQVDVGHIFVDLFKDTNSMVFGGFFTLQSGVQSGRPIAGPSASDLPHPDGDKVTGECPIVPPNAHVWRCVGACDPDIQPDIEERPWTTLVRSRKLRSMPASAAFTVEFELQTHRKMPGWTNILHLGHTNWDRLPGCWFHGYSHKIHCCATSYRNGVQNTCVNGLTGPDGIRKVKVELDASRILSLYEDGIKVDSRKVSSRFDRVATEVHPLYVSDPWYNAASCGIRGLTFNGQEMKLDPLTAGGSEFEFNGKPGIEVRRLRPNTWHRLRVRGMNTFGWGAWSDPVQVMTQKGTCELDALLYGPKGLGVTYDGVIRAMEETVATLQHGSGIEPAAGFPALVELEELLATARRFRGAVSLATKINAPPRTPSEGDLAPKGQIAQDGQDEMKRQIADNGADALATLGGETETATSKLTEQFQEGSGPRFKGPKGWCYDELGFGTKGQHYHGFEKFTDIKPDENDQYQESGVVRGQMAVTESGLPCQAWALGRPHTNAFNRPPFMPAEETNIDIGGDGNNFCRNPDFSDHPWCFTYEPTKEWEYCNVCNEPEIVNDFGFEPKVYQEDAFPMHAGVMLGHFHSPSACALAASNFGNDCYFFAWPTPKTKEDRRPEEGVPLPLPKKCVCGALPSGYRDASGLTLVDVGFQAPTPEVVSKPGWTTYTFVTEEPKDPGVGNGPKEPYDWWECVDESSAFCGHIKGLHLGPWSKQLVLHSLVVTASSTIQSFGHAENDQIPTQDEIDKLGSTTPSDGFESAMALPKGNNKPGQGYASYGGTDSPMGAAKRKSSHMMTLLAEPTSETRLTAPSNEGRGVRSQMTSLAGLCLRAASPMNADRTAAMLSCATSMQTWHLLLQANAPVERCLTSMGAGTDWSPSSSMGDCITGRKDQQWLLDDGRLISRHDGKCLELGPEEGAQPTHRVLLEPCKSRPEQQWRFDGDTIKSSKHGLCMVEMRGTLDLGVIPCNDTLRGFHRWFFVLQLDQDDAWCLEATGGRDNSAEHAVTMSECRQTDGQKWSMKGGTAQLSSHLNPRECMHVDAVSMQVSMQTCRDSDSDGNGSSQAWML